MGSVTKLPSGWIRKESRSRPNTFYFFNTATGKSQWHSPASSNNSKSEKGKEIKGTHHVLRVTHTKAKTTTKNDGKNKSYTTENHTRHKIDDKSKESKCFFSFLCILN